MAVEDSIFKEVRKAVEEGDRPRARDLLSRALRRDQNDVNVWLWMSAVVDTPKERAYCLQEALRIDPNNVAAKRGLNMMGELVPEPYSGEPQRLKSRNWQGEVDKGKTPTVQLPWKKIGLYGGGAIIALGLLMFAIFGPKKEKVVISYDLNPTITPSPTLEPTMTPTWTGPTPPWLSLAATYTPTPLYVNTPHPIIEAYRLSIRAFERTEWDKAIGYLQQSIQSEPNTADLPYLLGEAYRLSGQYGEAAKAYDQSLQANAGFAPAYLGRALNQWAMDPGQVDQIRSDLEAALTYDPHLPETLTQLGRLDLETGNPESALERFNAAESQNLAFPVTYYNRARAYLALGDVDAALVDAERASQSDLTMVPAYLTLGEALQANNRLVDSVVPLEIYIRYAQSVDPAVYLKITRAYRAAGNYQAALESVTKVLEQVPDSLEAIVERGYIYLESGEGQKALEDFDAVLAADPNSFDAGIARARALILLGAYSDAVQQLDQTEPLAQDDTQRLVVDFYRAQALDTLDTTSAIVVWERILNAPDGLVPDEWRALAQVRLSALYTPTVNPFLPTDTSTVNPFLPTDTPTP